MDTNTPIHVPSNSPEQKTLMAILAYIGPLVIISYLFARKDHFVKFHIKQGLLLLVGCIITWILSGSFWQFFFVINILNLAIFVLAVIGIINVLNKQTKELPLVGHLAEHFKF